MRNTPTPQSLNDEEIVMSQTTQEKNKALVLEAFNTLFNKTSLLTSIPTNAVAAVPTASLPSGSRMRGRARGEPPAG